MRRRLAGAVVFLALLAVAAFLAPSASAQNEFGPTLDHDVSPSFLYMKPQVTDTIEGPVYDEACYQDSAPTDQQFPRYGLSTTPPSPTGTERIYDTGWSTPQADCTLIFRYHVEEAFTISEGLTASVWLDCHRPTPVVGTPSGTDGFEFSWGFILGKNGEEVHRSMQTATAQRPAGVCSDALGPGARLNGVLEPERLTYKPGDTLEVSFAHWSQTSPGNTSYALVDGFDAPSALYGPDLPGMIRSDPAARVGVDLPNATLEAGPGNETTVDVRIENGGATGRTVTVNVDGADRWVVHPEPRILEVPGGGEGTVTLVAAVPPDAPEGADGTHEVTLSSEDEDIVFETTTRAVPGTGSPTDLVSADGDADGGSLEAGDLSEAGGAEAQSEDDTLADTVSELWVEALATAIIATIAAAIGVVAE